MSGLIHIQGLCKAFSGETILQNLDLEVAAGELLCIIGASGCGKSTLLRCIGGLEEIDSGRISVGTISYERNPVGKASKQEAQQLKRLRGRFGMVFQTFNLFPHLNLLQNVTIAPEVVRGIAREEAQKTAIELLNKVGLGNHLNHYPVQLSGGQSQRAAIARALAMTPQVMLYDEPTSALDPTLVGEVFKVMKQLKAEGMTQILVTHEMSFAKSVADRVVFLHDGDIVEQGTPEQIFSAPKHALTREYLGRFIHP